MTSCVSLLCCRSGKVETPLCSQREFRRSTSDLKVENIPSNFVKNYAFFFFVIPKRFRVLKIIYVLFIALINCFAHWK